MREKDDDIKSGLWVVRSKYRMEDKIWKKRQGEGRRKRKDE